MNKKGNTQIDSMSVDLDDLHCRIIRCITPHSKCDTARDDSEMRAWRKVKGRVKADDVEVIEQFYRAGKSEQCDPTWKRKTGVTQLLNQWTEQVELAREFATAGPGPGGANTYSDSRFDPKNYRDL